MAPCDNENVEDLTVRVFKWNEELHTVGESEGLFLFRIKNATKFLEYSELFVFELGFLSTRNTTELLVSQVIEGKDLFSDETTGSLIESVSSHLLSCFRFDIETSPQIKKPTIVIVVDVYAKRMNRTRKRISSPSSSEEDESNSEVSLVSQAAKKRKVGDSRVRRSRLTRSMIEKREDNAEKLRAREVQEIRRTLMCRLKEPLLLWIKPRVRYEPSGLRIVEAALTVTELDCRELPEDSCSICLEDISGELTMIATTPCSHVFHRDCLFRWLPNNSGCPLCRSDCATLV